MRLTSLAKIAAVPAFLLFSTFSTASAATVTFSTLGDFNGGGNVLTIGNLTITFAGVTNVTVDTPSNTSFGDITMAIVDTAPPENVGAVPFTITINQTAPFAGSGNLLGTTVAGQVSFNNSGVNLTFTTPQVSIGSIVYTIPNLFLLVPPSTNGGVTTLQGNISEVAIPEPTSLALLGGGALLLLLGRRRSVRS